jgi:hypothetical protein
MRSIKYILGGQPKCFEDCVDYARHHDVNEVTLALKERTDHSEDVIVDRLIGVFIWDFDDRVVTYEEHFGGVIEPEDDKREELSRKNANRRLENRLDEFEHNDIAVKNAHLRF